MTAIAAFSVDTCPVVFGDLLLTGPSEIPRQVAVPAIGDVHDFFGDSGWSILGLAQKVVLINECCVIAWSGSWLGASVAISELRSLAATTALTTDGVRAFLAGHPDVRAQGTSFVGWVYESENSRFGQFRYDAEVIDAGRLGRMSIEGTGKGAIKDLVDMWKGMHVRHTGEVNSAVRAIATGFAMSSMLLRAELHGGSAAPTLLSMFGGGYEVAAFYNGRFRKAPNLTFILWSADVTSDGVKLSLPQLIVRQAYLDDFLLIRSAKVSTDNGKYPQLTDEQRHVILPMYSTELKLPREELANLTWSSQLLCHCFMVQGETPEDLMIHTRVQQTAATAPTVKFEDSDGYLGLDLNEGFLRDVAQSLQDGMVSRPRASPNLKDAAQNDLPTRGS